MELGARRPQSGKMPSLKPALSLPNIYARKAVLPMVEHKVSTLFHLPEIVKGPWTPAARQRALDREVQAHYIEYFGRAMKLRNWSPWHHLPLEEMGQWG